MTKPRIFTPFGMVPGNASLLDWVRGPWPTVQAFKDNVETSYRTLGMEFLVEEGGGYALYRLQGNVDNAVLISTSAIENITFWISPPATELVTVRPGSPSDGDRILVNTSGTWTVEDYNTSTASWDIIYDETGAVGTLLEDGMAIIVNLVVISGTTYTNQLYVFEDGAFVRKEDGVAPDQDLFFTDFDGFSKRTTRNTTVVDLNALENSGLYKGDSDLTNMPTEFLAYSPVKEIFIEVAYDDSDNILQKVSSSDNSYIRVKEGGTWSSWQPWKGIDGGPWTSAGGVVSLDVAEPIDMQSEQINDLADGTSAGDAVNKGQLDLKQDKDPTDVDADTLTDTSIFQFWKTTIKKITWANIKLTIKTYTDTLYEAIDATILRTTDVINNLTSTDTDKPLSAAQGKELEDTKEDDLGNPANDNSYKEYDIAGTRSYVQSEELDTVEEVSAEIKTAAEAGGTSTSLTGDTLADTTKAWTVNEHADKYCVITYSAETQVTPIPKECIKILSNTADTLTFNKTREYAEFTSVADYEFLTPIELLGTEQHMLSAYVQTRDTIIELPAVSADNERNYVKVYNEFETPTTNNNRTWIYALGTDTIYGTDNIQMSKSRESVVLKQHAVTGNFHWDAFIDNRCIYANTRLETASAAFDASTASSIRAASWLHNTPRGFEIRETDTAGVVTFELIYTNTLSNLLKLDAVLTAVRSTAGSAIITAWISKYDGVSAWDRISNLATVELSAQNDTATLPLLSECDCVTGDKFRVEFQSSDSTTIQITDFIGLANKV